MALHRGRVHRGALAATAAIAVLTTACICGVAIASINAVVPAHANLAEDAANCVADVDRIAAPSHALLGEAVDITLTAHVVCAGDGYYMHIALVLDASGGMDGQPNRTMRSATRDFVLGLDMDWYGIRSGVAEFDDSARTLMSVTGDEQRVINAVGRVGASGGSRIDHGMQEGLRLLERGRTKYETISEALILLSDGHTDVDDRHVLAAAQRLKREGVLVIAVCVGQDCNERLMRRLAHGPRYFFRVENMSGLLPMFHVIRERMGNVWITKIVVEDTLPPHVRYVEGSARPAPSNPKSPTDRLEWTDDHMPSRGLSFTYKVRPIAPGYGPATGQARGEITDNKDRKYSFGFPVPWITTLRPDVLPTPEWTATPTPTSEPATPTPPPSVEPPQRFEVSLPVVWGGSEDPLWSRPDLRPDSVRGTDQVTDEHHGQDA